MFSQPVKYNEPVLVEALQRQHGNLNLPACLCCCAPADLLASCRLSQIGRFFGEVDGSIMASLLKMGMFKKVSLFDYQAMCKTGHHHASSARPLLSVSLVTI
uniref:Voltage-dependent calcium channel alpha-2/delta subunit conserved region domain-containing protein n=1 Tax=Neolamprologus brichardi TaxID=32507 RepID=A0A3Q4IDN6_NEOBR